MEQPNYSEYHQNNPKILKQQVYRIDSNEMYQPNPDAVHQFLYFGNQSPTMVQYSGNNWTVSNNTSHQRQPYLNNNINRNQYLNNHQLMQQRDAAYSNVNSTAEKNMVLSEQPNTATRGQIASTSQTKSKQNKSHDENTKYKTNQFNVSIAYKKRSKQLINMLSSLSPDQRDQGIHILTVPLARLAILAHKLPSKILTQYEVVGEILSDSIINLSHVSGFRFTLMDGQLSQACVLYDMDTVAPYPETGRLYRCIGLFHMRQCLFQCYTLAEISPEERKIIKVFEMRSERQVSELLQKFETHNKEY